MPSADSTPVKSRIKLKNTFAGRCAQAHAHHKGIVDVLQPTIAAERISKAFGIRYAAINASPTRRYRRFRRNAAQDAEQRYNRCRHHGRTVSALRRAALSFVCVMYQVGTLSFRPPGAFAAEAPTGVVAPQQYVGYRAPSEHRRAGILRIPSRPAE